MPTTRSRPPALTGRLVQLLLSCVVLGVGVALLLAAELGSDGYSMLINGLSLSLGVEFALVNVVVGVVLVLLAWSRGRVPGLGTLAQPVVVGVTVSVLLPLLPTPDPWAGRAVEFALGFLVLAVGVAGYLATDLGAGPTEAAAMAFDPPVPFRWSYSMVQVAGAAIGWSLGATLGLGTVLVVLLVGPVVDLVQRRLFAARTPAYDAEVGREVC